MPSGPTAVVRTYLELCKHSDLRPSPSPTETARLVEAVPLTAAEYRDIYSKVGERWHWRDRLLWSDSDLEAYLASPDVRVTLLHLGEDLAGYFELQRHPDHRIEVVYFGLVSAFIGRGLGGWMLTCAVERAFALGATGVFLNTCTLDAPQALPNYLARGFRIVREERFTLDLPY